MTGIKEHMEVVGADGVHIGTVDKLEGRIKLTKKDSGEGAHKGHHPTLIAVLLRVSKATRYACQQPVQLL